MYVTMAAETSTQRCTQCTSVLTPGAAWCGLCLRPIQAAAVAPVDSLFDPARGPVDRAAGEFRTSAPAAKADLFSESRWRSSSVTFGPVGRIIMTILLFLPYGLFMMSLPFGVVGMIVWTGLLIPGLRDVWRRDRHHHQPPPAA